MTTSDQNRRGLGGNNVGAWMKRPIVNERYELTRAYPDPLMPVSGVRVGGFTITLDNQLTSKPEAAAESRRIFEHLTDLIEDAVGGFNSDVLAHDQQGHVGSSLVGDNPVSTDAASDGTPTNGGAA